MPCRNDYFVGKINPINKERYVHLQDIYVIKGQVPIKQVTLEGQIYYVILADKIDKAKDDSPISLAKPDRYSSVSSNAIWTILV
jgi:hypothetical protein